MSQIDTQGCGCCGGIASPAAGCQIRPALSAIPYRFADYPRFMQAMLSSAAGQGALNAWTSRSSSDFGMAILGMWAHLADILTFYQERIANESYLRTATQRENVRRLAAALGYRLGPGAAATVFLAFTLDKDKALIVPVGLKSQSVPLQNQKPQKFETVEEVAMDAKWNRLPAFPEPTAYTPFAVGRTWATLLNEANHVPPLAAGRSVILFDTAQAEIKSIASLKKSIIGTILTWSDPVKTTFTQAQTQAYTHGRTFRIFGAQAPSSHVKLIADDDSPNGLRWQKDTTSFSIAANTSTFNLEMTVEHLKPGSEMLQVCTDGSKNFVRKGTVTQAVPQVVAFGGLEATVTAVTLQFTQPPPASVSTIDRRRITLYELTGPSIALATTQYPAQITGGQIHVPLSELPSFPAKRTILIDDGAPDPHVATVESTSTSSGHLVIHFSPSLARAFATLTCSMLGNVAKATHGETVRDEVLGNGDAAQRLQTFELRKNPVTFVPRAGAPNGVADTVEIRVDGVLWKLVPSLLGAAADARVYTTLLAEEGKMTIQFGGEPGARLPSGRNNVVAKYRKGIGPDGNVGAARVTTLLDRPAGLKSVVNPIASAGGSAPESMETARANAPNTVKTFGRIVSLSDFEDAARESAVVAKARVALDWNGTEQTVSVAVAGAGGTVLPQNLLNEVLDDLNTRRDLNRKLTVRGHVAVPVLASARVQVVPEYLLEDVEAAVRAALLGLFAFDNRELGQPAFQSEMFKTMQAVKGVVAVDLDLFRYQNQGPNLRDVLTATWYQMLTLDTQDLILNMQFGTL